MRIKIIKISSKKNVSMKRYDLKLKDIYFFSNFLFALKFKDYYM